MPSVYDYDSHCTLFAFASGSLSRFLIEVQSGKPIVLHDSNESSSTLPELHDWLLKAAENLPLIPCPPDLRNYDIAVRPYRNEDLTTLFEASNGSPQYHESAYDAGLFWAWLDKKKFPEDLSKAKSADNKDTMTAPTTSEAVFGKWITKMNSDGCSCQLAIVGKEFRKPIGMIGLCGNSPRDLSICIGTYSMYCTTLFMRRERDLIG